MDQLDGILDTMRWVAEIRARLWRSSKASVGVQL